MTTTHVVTTQFSIRNIINFCASHMLCAVQLVVITNSVFMNNVLPTSWYVYVHLRTLPYSVQIYDAQSETLKQNSGIQSLIIMYQ